MLPVKNHYPGWMDHTLKITGQREITGWGGRGLQDLPHRIGWLPHNTARPSALHTLNPSLPELIGLSGTNLVDPAPKRLMCTTDSRVLLSPEKPSLQGAQVFILSGLHRLPWRELWGCRTMIGEKAGTGERSWTEPPSTGGGWEQAPRHVFIFASSFVKG